MTLQVFNAPGELGTWNEGENCIGESWEEALVPDEDYLVKDSKAIIKEKRNKEREFRRQAQDLIRAQQRMAGSHHSLGTKTTDHTC